MIHVWAFDPGKVTGWAHLSVIDDELSLFRSGQSDHFEIGDMFQNNDVFNRAVDRPDVEPVFVCETFLQSPTNTQAPWSLETIGLIRYWANYYKIPLKMQMPSEAKTLVKDSVLKKADLWTPGMDHARDATRHALYYLIKNKRLFTSCLVPMEW